MNRYGRWPLAITTIYILFVLILVIFVIYTQYQTVDLVSDDYYQQELIYQQQIDRIQRTESLSDPVTWHHDQMQKSLTLQFSAELTKRPIQGQILFFRPSDAKQDKLVAINPSPEGNQTISTKQLTSGYWKIKIFWHIAEEEFYKEGVLIIK